MHSSDPIRKARVGRLCFLAALLLCVGVARAQIAVTSVTYGALVDGLNSSQSGLTFQSQYTPVINVATSLSDYHFNGPIASSVTFRRNTNSSSPNNSTVFYQTVSGTTNKPLGNYDSTLEQVMLSGNLTQGLRNPFGNGTSPEDSNIERIDFRLANYVVQASDALVFFDLENYGNFGDGFRIAAYTAVGTVNGFSNAPTVYANAGILVGKDTFGGPISSPTNGIDGSFIRATYTSGNSLTGTPTTSSLGSNLNLAGILISFSDLGITAGTTIQGFSLMAGDVPITTAANLVNWNNTNYFPTNTDPNAYGNMDFAGFGAQIARPVPEPSIYGAILIGSMAFIFGLRRYRRIRPAAA